MPQPTEAETRETRRRREIEAAALALLLIERRNLRAVNAALTLAVKQAKLLGTEPSLARAAIAVHVTNELLRSRRRARVAARPIWKQQTGVTLRAPAPNEVLELSRAAGAGQSIARRWRVLESELAQETPKGSGPHRTYGPAAEETAPTLERAVVTETADAWNTELRELGLAAQQLGFITTFTWDAEGLRTGFNTCSRCRALDGLVVIGSEEFPEGWPPLHPHCRCQIQTSLTRLH